MVRRQLGDPVGDDGAGEVDRLAASAAEWKFSDASQAFEYLERRVAATIDVLAEHCGHGVGNLLTRDTPQVL